MYYIATPNHLLYYIFITFIIIIVIILSDNKAGRVGRPTAPSSGQFEHNFQTLLVI